MKVSFVVYSRAEPQGSIRAFMPKGWKRPVLTSDNPKVKGFRKEVAAAAKEAMAGQVLEVKPYGVELRVKFFFLKPHSAKKRGAHTVKPDIDKLCRSVSDSLTDIVYEDDSQIVRLVAEKAYGAPERVEIEVRTAEIQESQTDAVLRRALEMLGNPKVRIVN